MCWNERFSPTGSTLRSEQDCNVYNCPRSKSESAAWKLRLAPLSYYVTVQLWAYAHHTMSLTSGLLPFPWSSNYSITPLGNESESSDVLVPFAGRSVDSIQVPPADDDAADHSGCPASSVPSVKEKSGIRSRSCTLWFSLAVRIKSSKPTARLLFPLPTFRMSCIRLIARTFK